ncbi:MAG: TonB-dependent receptor plug domain-containing protein, partial [Terriglobia bacterium]
AKEAERDKVYLRLAETLTVDLTLAAPAANEITNLGAVNVTANALSATFQPDNKGISTNVSQRELQVLPNPDRSIQSIARLDPFIILTNNNQAGGFTQINALGQNNRYNNITIDAVPTNDSFGLEANGLPSLNQPISYDAIEEYNISTANYDVTSKRAVGANINIVTKSGTNEFHGSAYYAWTNAKDLTGEDYKGNEFGGYTQRWTDGITLGGPIVKDKLFFFINAEESKLDAPGADFGTIDSNAANTVPVTQDQLNQIIDIASNQYGMTPGNLSASSANQDEKKYLAKIDWNISEGHRLSVRASEVKSTQPIIQGNFTGSRPALGLSSYWYTNNRNLKQYVANLYDDWSDTFSTEASLSYAKYRSTPTTLADQPMVQVYVDRDDPATQDAAVYLGEDQFRHYNVLNVDTLNGFFAGTWFLGDHTMKAGFDYQRDKFYNLFGRTEFGAYTFNSINDFRDGNYSFYQLYQPAPGYSLSDIAARWSLNQEGLFLQDTWAITPRFSLQYGLRLDIPGADGTPVLNP